MDVFEACPPQLETLPHSTADGVTISGLVGPEITPELFEDGGLAHDRAPHLATAIWVLIQERKYPGKYIEADLSSATRTVESFQEANRLYAANRLAAQAPTPL